MGFNTGTIANEWEPKKLTYDRDIEFPIDPMDVDESNLVLEVANILKLKLIQRATRKCLLWN